MHSLGHLNLQGRYIKMPTVVTFIDDSQSQLCSHSEVMHPPALLGDCYLALSTSLQNSLTSSPK